MMSWWLRIFLFLNCLCQPPLRWSLLSKKEYLEEIRTKMSNPCFQLPEIRDKLPLSNISFKIKKLYIYPEVWVRLFVKNIPIQSPSVWPTSPSRILPPSHDTPTWSNASLDRISFYPTLKLKHVPMENKNKIERVDFVLYFLLHFATAVFVSYVTSADVVLVQLFENGFFLFLFPPDMCF